MVYKEVSIGYWIGDILREVKESLLSNEKIEKDMYIIIRCDGRSFTKFKKKGNLKTFDKDFHKKMVKISEKALLNLFNNSGFAYTISDEISFVLPKEFELYNRRVEKLISLAAGYLSGEGSLEFYELGFEPAVFDAKIFVFKTIEGVLEYLDERKNSGFRNFVCSITREHYMKKGMTSSQAAKKMNGMTTRKQIELLLGVKKDIYKMNGWKREGEMIHFVIENNRKFLRRAKPLRFCLEDKVIIERFLETKRDGGSK